MSFNNGYYFFEHADDQISGYIMFRRSGHSIRVQVLIENLNVQADNCSIYLSNINNDKLFLSDIPFKKSKLGRKTGSCDLRYDEDKKPELKGFDCAHVVVSNKSLLETYSGSKRQFDRDMFLDKKKLVSVAPRPVSRPIEVKQENKQNELPETKTVAPTIEKESPIKTKWEWDDSYKSTEMKVTEISDLTKDENYLDNTFNKMLIPYDPFNTTNVAYSWWVADNYKVASDCFNAINITIPSIVSKFLYNNMESHKHAVIGRYIQDGRKFIILGIPSEKQIDNSVARWMKCSAFYNNTKYSGYLLYYIDARNSSLVKAVQQD